MSLFYQKKLVRIVINFNAMIEEYRFFYFLIYGILLSCSYVINLSRASVLHIEKSRLKFAFSQEHELLLDINIF